MAKAKRSARYETVRKWHLAGLWSRARVEKAVECGWITQREAEDILKEGISNGRA